MSWATSSLREAFGVVHFDPSVRWKARAVPNAAEFCRLLDEFYYAECGHLTDIEVDMLKDWRVGPCWGGPLDGARREFNHDEFCEILTHEHDLHGVATVVSQLWIAVYTWNAERGRWEWHHTYWVCEMRP